MNGVEASELRKKKQGTVFTIPSHYLFIYLNSEKTLNFEIIFYKSSLITWSEIFFFKDYEIYILIKLMAVLIKDYYNYMVQIKMKFLYPGLYN